MVLDVTCKILLYFSSSWYLSTLSCHIFTLISHFHPFPSLFQPHSLMSNHLFHSCILHISSLLENYNEELSDDTPPVTPQKSPKSFIDHTMNNNQTSNRSHQTYMLDPYYMHPSENPCISIISPSLTTKTFTFGPNQSNSHFGPRKKLWFLDGTLVHPYLSNWSFLAWDCCKTMVMACLTNSIKL